MTRILGNLEKHQLVIRTEHPNDGRSKVVFLTSESKKMEKALIKIAGETQASATKGLSSEALKDCQQVLNQIMNNLT
jgi:DNA-binding MarR family transcriptional regulator